MRASRLVLPILTGGCLMAGAVCAAPDAAPVRRAGFWETTMTLEGASAHTMVTKACTDAALERRTAAFGDAKDCPTHEMHRTADGFAFRSICVRNGVTTTTAGAIKGDLTSRYRVEATTRISSAGGGPGRERHTVMDNRRLGDCPAGRKPGDLVLSNGQVLSMGGPQ